MAGQPFPSPPPGVPTSATWESLSPTHLPGWTGSSRCGSTAAFAHCCGPLPDSLLQQAGSPYPALAPVGEPYGAQWVHGEDTEVCAELLVHTLPQLTPLPQVNLLVCCARTAACAELPHRDHQQCCGPSGSEGKLGVALESLQGRSPRHAGFPRGEHRGSLHRFL